ncbi:chemotaxis protein MotB [Tamilnaduibacter salinus]|uniref:Chemotaxis protein MotB n=1 Tax=Tamilnaduibacter salinus TaxID=1484056 RepID=A0A2A2I5R3_9GAMM|nr:flagellar motor protein MotD [Tamilnaduibacter salinus]PAV27351.1 flagellar motor protein MotD [Tamilnaduibacter salinus]PVY79276.1 chemotaxis protein MotB [Tamilnaduibacter salinus]
MRRRRQQPDSPLNRERWLISYADFITLLFGFFVVMYSVSSVNQGKYKVLSETLTGVFNAPQRSVRPVPVGDSPAVRPPASEQVIQPPVNQAPEAAQGEGSGSDASQSLKSMAGHLQAEFQSLIRQGVVSVETNEQWIELSLRNSLLFGSGTAEPHYDAFPVAEKIAGIVDGYNNAVRVEGFTDNRPIQTASYPTNWELSAARAAAIVRLLAQNGVDPQRMAAVGYGAHQPVARNDTPEGRSRNRRVVILISRGSSVRAAGR